MAVEIAEQFADGSATEEERICAHSAAAQVVNEMTASRMAFGQAAIYSACAAEKAARPSAIDTLDGRESAARAAAFCLTEGGLRGDLAVREVTEQNEQAVLLRHIIPYSSRSLSIVAPLPNSVTLLAQAVYEGASYLEPLHDALLEFGRSDLAQHFSNPSQRHPRGCSVLDLILQKN